MARTGENIYKRKDGRWEGRLISSHGENDKAKYKYVYARTYGEVKTKLLQLSLCKESTQVTHPHFNSNIWKYTYVLDEWLSSKKLKIKDSTYIRYRNSIENHIKPHLGKYAIDKIDTSLMANFISELMKSGKLNSEGGLSAKTVSDILVIIKESFVYAQNNGMTTICNFDNISLKCQNHEMRVLSCSEMQRLEETLLNQLDLYKLGVLLCLFTGIRIGELCALQWNNISIIDKSIKIEQTMQRLQTKNMDTPRKTKIIITGPKSFASIRSIPLPNFLVGLIKPYCKDNNAYFLTGECERFIEPRVMQNRFKEYLKKSGIRDANFHCLRHTFATRCVESGFDIKTLSEILGHSSVKITLDKYVHSSMEQKRLNMDKLQILIN